MGCDRGGHWYRGRGQSVVAAEIRQCDQGARASRGQSGKGRRISRCDQDGSPNGGGIANHIAGPAFGRERSEASRTERERRRATEGH